MKRNTSPVKTTGPLQQPTVIEQLIQSLRNAGSSLRTKQHELESQNRSETSSRLLIIIEARLETLKCIEEKLLAPLANELSRIAQSGETLHRWERQALRMHRRGVFEASMLDGLEVKIDQDIEQQEPIHREEP